MSTITIPRKFAQKDDLIIVPRKEYEALIELRKTGEFAPTAAQRMALSKVEQNLKVRKGMFGISSLAGSFRVKRPRNPIAIRKQMERRGK